MKFPPTWRFGADLNGGKGIEGRELWYALGELEDVRENPSAGVCRLGLRGWKERATHDHSHTEPNKFKWGHVIELPEAQAENPRRHRGVKWRANEKRRAGGWMRQ
jgi:hypothetical protein